MDGRRTKVRLLGWRPVCGLSLVRAWAGSLCRRPTFWRIGRILGVFLLIGTAGILIARTELQSGYAGVKSREGKTLRFDLFYPIGTLDSRLSEGDAPLVLNFLYSYLFIMNEDGRLEPDLATSWSYDKANFTWVVHIRKEAQFHDGSPLTASDVVHSLVTAIEMVLPSEGKYVDRITAEDDHVIVISLKKDDPLFLEKIWSFEILKRPEKNNKKDPGRPIGSGPFIFEYRIKNSEVGLTANEHYYLGRPKLDKVVFYYQPDKEKSWARLLAGKTDIVRGIEPQDYRIMERYEDRFYFKTTIEPYLILLLYNPRDATLIDPRIRMALSHAINKQNIVSTILGGMGVAPPGYMGHYSTLGDPGLEPIAYDPAKSLRLLHEAGWTYDSRGHYLQKEGKPFELTILCFDENRLHNSIARYVQLCLNEIGIRVYIEPLPFNELIRRYWHKPDFQAVLTELADVRDGLNPVLDSWEFFLNRKCAGSGNLSNYRITAIVDQIKKEPDSSRRRALLAELNSLLESLHPATPLVQKTSLDVLSKRFVAPCDLSNMYYKFKLWQVSPASE